MLHVTTGAERPAGPGQNGDAGLGVFCQAAKQPREREQHLAARGVEIVRAVERDDAQRTFGDDLDLFGKSVQVWHAWDSYVSMRISCTWRSIQSLNEVNGIP